MSLFAKLAAAVVAVSAFAVSPACAAESSNIVLADRVVECRFGTKKGLVESARVNTTYTLDLTLTPFRGV